MAWSDRLDAPECPQRWRDSSYAQEHPGSAALSYLAAGLARAGRDVLAIDLSLLGGGEDMNRLASVASREARLRGAALVVTHVESVAERGPVEVRRWAEPDAVVVLTGNQPWDPRWSRRPTLVVDVPHLADSDRANSWNAALGLAAPQASISRAVAAYRLTPEQVRLAAEGASATSHGSRVRTWNRTTCRWGRELRTRPGYKSWPAVFLPEPPGRTWSYLVTSTASCGQSPVECANGARSSTSGG